MAFDPSCDVAPAIGSGVINACCKVLAHATGRVSIAVGTAPFMDGYASNSSSMIRNRVKVTLYNACPAAILADHEGYAGAHAAGQAGGTGWRRISRCANGAFPTAFIRNTTASAWRA